LTEIDFSIACGLIDQEFGDQKTRNDEKNVDANESPGEPFDSSVVCDDKTNGEGTQPLDITSPLTHDIGQVPPYQEIDRF